MKVFNINCESLSSIFLLISYNAFLKLYTLNWSLKNVKLSGNKKIKISELSKFPSVKRDLALLLDNTIQFKEIYNLAFQSERKYTFSCYVYIQGSKEAMRMY